MGKYNHLFPKMSDYEKDKMRREFQKAVKNIDIKQIWEGPINDYELKCEAVGYDPFDVTMMGPWTLNEYFDMIGLQKSKFTGYDKTSLLKVMEDFGAIPLDIKKDKKGKFTVEHSAKGKEELEACATEKLSRWDKFCAFFGIKTSHALQVETKAATIEAMNEKQKEVSKSTAIKQFKAVFDGLKDSNFDLEKLKNNTKEKNDGWHKVFFGDAKVPDYTLANGNKISSVSLCLAALQQRTKWDLASMDPKDVIERMNREGNEKISEQIKKIGENISRIATKKDAAVNMSDKLKYLDNFLFENPGGVAIDDELRAYIKPDKNGRKFDIMAATDYSGMVKGKDKEKMFATSAIMFKTKDDMQKLFGKNDPTYNMINDKTGKRLNEAADKMEQYVRKVFKAIRLTDEVMKDNYEAVLNEAGFGDDYNKLKEATEYVADSLRKIQREFSHGELSKEAIDYVNKKIMSENRDYMAYGNKSEKDNLEQDDMGMERS